MSFDVLIVGGGHAGAEAAALAARLGARTLLLTQNLETIGQMSCNPAIGGIGKGTVVREVDALGGVMGRATDRARIQFRMLNRSKGPAVWSPRAQCDRGLYRRAVRQELERHERIAFEQGTVAGLLFSGERIRGVVTTEGRRILARAVVITAGTFLRGRIHMGLATQVPAGRAGEAPAVELSQVLEQQGLTVQRFKTGTPPRIDGRTVDLAAMVRQDGDIEGYWFSSHVQHGHPEQRPCYLTWAGAEVREIIQRHLSQSALYGGAISGRGPRYCPSVEDKIVKFPDAERHQVFLEPEGLATTEMYVNGLSTSLPPAVQLEFLRAVPGLEQVRMTRPGYAIEYDYFPPTQLRPTLEVRSIPGLFFAGQINGTTGYEEAAGQGAIAGINAACSALGREPVVLRRDQAIIGVLTDDLTQRGVDEPYRLFTSRAELRLLLRQDNALRRLVPLAVQLGTLTDEERAAAEARLEREELVLDLARETAISPERANPLLEGTDSRPLDQPTRVAEVARRPGVGLKHLLAAAEVEVDPADTVWAELELKYQGYLDRERAMAQRMGQMEDFTLPETLEFRAIETLSIEGRERLHAARPGTLGQASRLPGMSPSDLQNLVVAVMKARSER